ncbi:MAG: DUF3048 domain-containing protein [Clostridia bacterium]|nr:DUF3048 domain-containing protein [Clostridia bacterium]
MKLFTGISKVPVIIVLVFSVLALVGCGSEDGKKTGNGIFSEKNGPVEEEQDLAANPLTGLKVKVGNLERRPLAVMIENHPEARPQDGLAQADLVYEMLSEGAITRFMAIYYGNDVEKIGPVRSARPYFIDRAFDYDAVYAYSGGSEEAKTNIKRFKVAALDEFANAKTYWRSKNRRKPHNLYTSTAKLWARASQKGYNREGNVPAFDFLQEGEELPGGIPAGAVTIKYPIGFSIVEYTYDENKGYYLRKTGGKLHLDRATGEQLAARNIIIQQVNTKVIDREGRREMEMVGSGKATLITGKRAYEATWQKDSRRGTTSFYLKNGEPIKLKPGRTWIQVVTTRTPVAIRGE